MTTTNTPTAGDTPRVIDVLITIPVMRDEADLWESVAKAMGRRGVSPLDAVHLLALTGLQLQLHKNNRLDEAAAVGERVAALAKEIGVWSAAVSADTAEDGHAHSEERAP